VANLMARGACRRVGALFASHLRADSHRQDRGSADSGMCLCGNRALKRAGHTPRLDKGNMLARHRTRPERTIAPPAAQLFWVRQCHDPHSEE
jgi:hypothetical protein